MKDEKKEKPKKDEREKPPPDWVPVWDDGKRKGFRNKKDGKRVASVAAAWRIALARDEVKRS